MLRSEESQVKVRNAQSRVFDTTDKRLMLEALVVTSVGGAIGLAVGYGLVKLMESALIMPMAFSPSILVLAFLTSVAVGIVFGIFPALRAARLDPVEALRYQ